MSTGLDLYWGRRQIEAKAMSKLRHPAYDADVRSLLGV